MRRSTAPTHATALQSHPNASQITALATSLLQQPGHEIQTRGAFLSNIGSGFLWAPAILFAEAIQTFILADLCYYYVESCMAGQLLVMLHTPQPAQRSTCITTHNGLLRKETPEYEEEGNKEKTIKEEAKEKEEKLGIGAPSRTPAKPLFWKEEVDQISFYKETKERIKGELGIIKGENTATSHLTMQAVLPRTVTRIGHPWKEARRRKQKEGGHSFSMRLQTLHIW